MVVVVLVVMGMDHLVKDLAKEIQWVVVLVVVMMMVITISETTKNVSSHKSPIYPFLQEICLINGIIS